MHQDYAFAVLLQRVHHRFDDLLGLPCLEVERIHVAREDADVPLTEIGHQFWWMSQAWETEEGRARRSQGHPHGADALLDFLLGQFDVVIRLAGEILVAPGVAPDRVSSCGYLLK